MEKQFSNNWKLTLLFIFFSGWQNIVAQFNSASADSFAHKEVQITDQHRFEENVMSGHWGHHLGHLVRTRTNGLWFVDDSGNDVNVTPQARYYQFVNDSVWVLQKEITNLGVVQQNTASVAVGDTIYTYGIDIDDRKLTENWLDTQTLESGSSNIANLRRDTNYIGAALSPANVRIVWWSNVVDGGGPCTWYYTYYEQNQWQPVVASDIDGYNDFSYVLAAFINDTTFYAAGQAIGGEMPNWTYQMAVAKVVVGQEVSEFTVLPGDNYTACDIWGNTTSGDIHILGNGKQANVTYYYKSAAGDWPGEPEIIANPDTLYRGTRFIESPDGYLYLIMSTPTGLKFKTIEKVEIAGKIPFNSAVTHDIHNNSGFNFIFAVFPERTELQSAPVGGINFAYPGNDYDYCHIIKHIEIQKTETTGICDDLPPNTPVQFELKPNYPNPFNAVTAIRYRLPAESQVKLSVYNLLGNQVATIVNERQKAGDHHVLWDASGLSSAIYYCRIEAGEFQDVKKMVLMK